MCNVEKFFFCVPLDLGCHLLGVFTFIQATFVALSSTILLVIECNESGRGAFYLAGFPQLVMNTTSVITILATVLVLALLWMLFSVMLVLGVRKNNSSFVLWYFSYGIMLTILCLLSALLLLLENHWIISLVQFIIATIYIHCLVVVHTTYELILSGTEFKYRERRPSDLTMLVDSTDDC